MELQNLGSVGYVKEGHDIISFQIGSTTTGSPVTTLFNNSVNPNEPVLMQVDNHTILLKGVLNNEPDDIEQLITENRILPELIEKQIRMLYGAGPHCYQIEFDEKGKRVRRWATNPEIDEMFDEWKLKGLPHSANDTVLQVARRYYYMEEFYPRFYFSLSRFLPDEMIQKLNLQPPIFGFELLENKRCRLASKKLINVFEDDYEEKDFDMVFVGNWNRGLIRKFKKYKKFQLSKARSYRVAVGHYKNDAVGSIYGVNKFYKGTREWILGSNLTPKNINSFIRNSLAAKVHVIIPDAWCESKKKMISAYCEINQKLQEENKTLIKINDIEIGTEYHEHLFTLYVNAEVKKLFKYLSGEDNQGKAFVSYSFRTGNTEEERWRFETIDLKYKEYVESLISYDKRSDEVLLSAKGIDGSISNITKDGVISKSGADLYYNYIIYLFMNRPIAEEKVMEPFNDMIRINKPHLYAEGWRRGLYVDVPQRQEDTSSNDRLQNQVNNTNAAVSTALSKVDALQQQFNELQNQK